MIAVASCGHNCDDERIYHQHIKTLLSHKYKIQYYTYCYNSYLEDKEDRTIEYRFFNSSEISQKQYKKILFNLLKNNPPKIFHIHDMELLSVAYKLKKRCPDVKIIYDVHEDKISMWNTFSSYSGIVKKIITTMLSKYEQYYLSCIDQFVILNRLADKTRYESYAPIQVIESFPLLENLQDFETINNPTKLIYHGQLSNERGIITLVEAFHILSKKNPNLELLLIGEFRKQNFKKNLISAINSNKKIQLLAPISHNKVWDYLNDSHIGIIPFHNTSLFDYNTPTKLFEYMASNCAIVSCEFAPIKEFCQDSILWARPEDVKSLAGEIQTYIDSSKIYNQHRKSNNQLILNDYHWENISHKLLTLYKELLN